MKCEVVQALFYKVSNTYTYILYVKDESKNVYKLFGKVEDFLSTKHLKLTFFVKLHFQYDI